MTSDSIKVVLYLAQPNDPILKYIEGAIADSDTNQQTIDTVKGYIKFLETYYETYGRHVDLVPFVGTGAADRRGGGPGRRHHHRRDHQAVRRARTARS